MRSCVYVYGALIRGSQARKNMITLLGLFLVCIYGDCHSCDTDFYRPNAQYDCTQNCSTTVKGTQRSYDTEHNSLCRCDRYCRTYGDCCANYRIICDEADVSTVSQLDGLLQCRSIHLDVRTNPDWMESFWMISAFPADWLAGRDDQDTFNNCTRGSTNYLPPLLLTVG